ncbi:sigma factor-like helix-turn-helix DNA-binding protein [Amycolatopsis lurida]
MFRWPRAADGPDSDRLAELVCRVTVGIGLTRRDSVRICRQLRREGLLPRSPQLSRGERDDVVAALRVALESRVDSAVLEQAVVDAVLLDEYHTLPGGQRDVLRAVLWQGRTVEELAGELGVSMLEVHARLRDGLRTLTTLPHHSHQCVNRDAVAGSDGHQHRAVRRAAHRPLPRR